MSVWLHSSNFSGLSSSRSQNLTRLLSNIHRDKEVIIFRMPSRDVRVFPLCCGNRCYALWRNDWKKEAHFGTSPERWPCLLFTISSSPTTGIDGGIPHFNPFRKMRSPDCLFRFKDNPPWRTLARGIHSLGKSGFFLQTTTLTYISYTFVIKRNHHSDVHKPTNPLRSHSFRAEHGEKWRHFPSREGLAMSQPPLPPLHRQIRQLMKFAPAFLKFGPPWKLKSFASKTLIKINFYLLKYLFKKKLKLSSALTCYI